MPGGGLLEKYGPKAAEGGLLAKYGPAQGLLAKYGQTEEVTPALQQFAHGAESGFGKLFQLAGRLLPKDPAGTDTSLGATSGTLKGDPSFWSERDAAEKRAQEVSPIKPGEEGNAAVTAGSVVGGLAQMPLMGAAAPVLAPLAFGGEATMETYDAVRAKGGSEEEAWKAALPQGALSAATTALLPKILAKVNIGSGGSWLANKARQAAAGAVVFPAVGTAEQTVSNLIHQHTDEPDRKLLTGMSGRAATDAATGILMSVLFPGHPQSERIASARAEARPMEPEVKLPGEERPPDAPQPSVQLPDVYQHPAQGHVDELKRISSRMTELDAQSKEMRQTGRAKDSLAVDQERIGLLNRQQDVALDMQAKLVGAAQEHPIDPRLGDPRIADTVRGMAQEWGFSEGYRQENPEGGGKIQVGAKPNHEWMLDRPHSDYTQPEIAKLVDKGIAGERLGPKQGAFLQWMLAHAERFTPPLEESGFPWESPEQKIAAYQGALTDAAASERMADGDPNARANAQEHVDSLVTDVKEAGREKQMDFTRPPDPPEDPPPSSELPDPKDPRFQDFLRKHSGAIAENELRAWTDRSKKHAELRDTLDLGLGEKFKAPGQGKYDQLGEAMTYSLDTLGKVDEEVGKLGDRLPASELSILARAGSLNPEQMAMRDRIIAENAQWGSKLKDAGVIHNIIENYSERLWKNPDREAPQKALPKFQTFSANALPRTFSSVLEGRAAGKELAIKNPIDAQYHIRVTTGRVLENKNFIDLGKKAGFFSSIQKQGYEQLDHPGFRDWNPKARIPLPTSAQEYAAILGEKIQEQVPIAEAIKLYGWAKEGRDGGVVGRNLLIKADRDSITILTKDPIYAPAAIAREVNKRFGQRPLSSDRFFTKVWKPMQDLYRRSLFAVPTFHQISETAHYMLAAPFENVKDLSPRAAYQDGYERMMSHDPEIMHLVRNNLRLIPQAEYSNMLDKEHGKIGQRLDTIPGIGPAKNFIQNELGDLKDFVFNKYIPGLQAKTALLEKARATAASKGRFSDQELAQSASRLANNVVGVSNPDIPNSPLWKDIKSYFLLAPQWESGAYRRAADLFNAGATGEAHRAMWTRAITRFAVAHVGWHLAMSYIQNPLHPVDEWEKMMQEKYGRGFGALLGFELSPLARKMGRTNPTGFSVGLAGNMFEPFGLGAISAGMASKRTNEKAGPIVAATSELQAKMGIVPRLVSELFTGTNYKGESYTTVPEFRGTDDKGLYKGSKLGQYMAGMEKGGKLEGQLTSYRSEAKPGGGLSTSQVPSWIMSQAIDAMPIPLQGLKDSLKGEMDALPALLQGLGFKVSKHK